VIISPISEFPLGVASCAGAWI